MIASEFRLEARKKLEGKWGKVACYTLAYIAVLFVLGFISGLFPESMSSILSLILKIIELPLSFGLMIQFFKLYNDEEVKTFDFLSLGFNNFKKAWSISINIGLKFILPCILFIISYILVAYGIISMIKPSLTGSTSSSGSFGILGIVGCILLIISIIWFITKSYYYQLAYIVAADNPELSSKEAVSKSEELMTNKRGKLFCLQFSFIGWSILACFTFGIGFLWLLPYVQFATIAFYGFAKGDSSSVQTEVIKENDNNPIQG